MKKNLIYFAITAALGIFTYFITSGDKTYKLEVENRKPFAELDPAGMDRITLSRGSSEVELTRQNGGSWNVVKLDYPAASDNVDGLVKNIRDLAIVDISSRNPEKGDVYGLGKLTTLVELSQGGVTKARLEVGKVGPDMISTYFKYTKGPEIYKTTTNLSYLCNSDSNYWIDKTLIKLKDEEISRIHILCGTREIELQRDGQWKWAKRGTGEVTLPKVMGTVETGASGALATSEVESLLSTVNNLVCEGLATGKKPDFTQEVDLSGEIATKGGEGIGFKFLTKEGSNYYVTISNKQRVFLVNSYQRDSLLREVDNLLKKKVPQ
ncbi:MAG: DUF4340 domain-containing protein [Candidatus Wallbacteria bacterium]|nr:DUF4340 domain-containing protein [Candidatus Wallbacteria bacterium]